MTVPIRDIDFTKYIDFGRWFVFGSSLRTNEMKFNDAMRTGKINIRFSHITIDTFIIFHLQNAKKIADFARNIERCNISYECDCEGRKNRHSTFRMILKKKQRGWME